MTRLRVSFVLSTLVLFLVACAPRPPALVTSIKVLVAGPGLYRLARGDLQSAGLALDAASLPRLRLTHQGAEIPIEIQQTANDFAVLFYAAPEKSPYSPTDVY